MFKILITIYAVLYTRDSSTAHSSQQVLEFDHRVEAEKAAALAANSLLPNGYQRTIVRLYDAG